MINFFKVLHIKMKLFLREYVTVFFTVMFCPLMLLLFGAIYGNEPSPIFNGLGTIDISIPSFTGLIFCGNGIISFPIAVATSREQGELRRYKMTPMPPVLYLLAEMSAYMILSQLGVIIMVLIGAIAYHTQFSGNVFTVILGLILSDLSIFACGMLIASISKNGKAAQAIGMLIGFPMMFLSGASMPVETMPDKLINVVQFLPSFHQVKMMRAMWAGEDFSNYKNSILVLLATIAVCSVLSCKLFKWEGSKK